jgi:hypothetical protein
MHLLKTSVSNLETSMYNVVLLEGLMDTDERTLSIYAYLSTSDFDCSGIYDKTISLILLRSIQLHGIKKV